MAESQDEQSGESLEVPQCPMHYMGLLGNKPDIDPRFITKSFWDLADLYGPILKLDIVNRKVILLSNHKFTAEAADDERFDKHVTGPLGALRALIGDGLFAGRNDEEV